MIYAKILNKDRIIKIQKGGSFGAIRFGKKSGDEAYAKYDFYPFVAGESVPSDKILLPSTYAFEEGKVVETTHFRELTDEETQQKQEAFLTQTKASFISVINGVIKAEIDKYNKDTNSVFENIDGFTKYLSDASNRHFSFASKILQWNADVWAKANEINTKVLSQEMEIPTADELVAMLPKLEDAIVDLSFTSIPLRSVIWLHGKVVNPSFLMCDGSTISDESSPLNGEELPDLMNKVIVGSDELGEGTLTYEKFTLYQQYKQWYKDLKVADYTNLMPYMRIK